LQQFIDAVYCSSGGEHLDGYAASRKLPPKPGIGPHAAVCAGSDDELLRMTIQHRAEVLHVQHVTLAPPPVLLHLVRGEEYIRTDVASVHHQFPEVIPVDVHTPSLAPCDDANKGPEVKI
jgi:hypothetical protein